MVRAGKISRRYTGAGGSTSLAHRAANPIVRAAAYFAGKALRSGVGTSSSRRRTSGRENVTSYQNDQRQIYRKKRMPRRRRRRWVRALRRNTAMDMQSEPTRTFTINGYTLAQIGGTDIVGSQFHLAVPLYSYNGTLQGTTPADVWRDMRRVCGNPIWGTNQDGKDVKFLFGSGVIDMTGVYQYTGTANNRLSADPTLELDMYVLDVSRRPSQMYGTWPDELSDATSELNGAATLSDRGTTPFQFPSLGNSEHRIKILSKRRWTLSVGQSFTYQYRDPRNRYVNASDQVNGLYAVKYRGTGTKLFLFVGKLIWTVAPVADTGTYGIRIGSTRTYTVKQLLASTIPDSAVVLP